MSLEITVKDFVRTAEQVCAQIERLDLGNTQPLLSVLVDLLRAANELTRHSIDADDCEWDEEVAAPNALSHVQNQVEFHVLFDPLDPQSLCSTTLNDALGDIYKSLKGGVQALQRHPDKENAILSDWKLEYEHHWGRHLIDVIRFFILCPEYITTSAPHTP
jgi:hypothetical protein